MKAIRFLVAALLTALISVLVTAAFQSRIGNLFRDDRIDGILEISEWRSQPVRSPPRQTQSTTQSPEDILRQIDERQREIDNSRGAFARLSLANNSDKVITNVRVRFRNARVDFLRDVEGEEESEPVFGAREIVIPEMRQGDELSYSLWADSLSATSLVADEVSTFSSSGPVRMEFKWPERQLYEESALETFMDDWLTAILISILASLMLLTGIAALAFENAAKKLVSDRKFYAAERKRFQDNPTKYVVSLGETPSSPKLESAD